MERHYITATEDDRGLRLDKFLVNHLTFLSRGRIREMINQGSVHINNTRVRKNSRTISPGDTVLIYIPAEMETRIDIGDIRIIHEEKGFIVVDKPSGLPADSTRYDVVNTLPGLLTKRYEHKQYIQTVHRLDAGTSGVMILSKMPSVTKLLNRQFSDKKVRKTYYALVMGRMKEPRGRIDGNLARNRHDPRKFKVVSHGGKPSVTDYTTEKTLEKMTLVKVNPLTGRTHQIRVHLAHIGYPLAGDWLYGDRTTANRLMLHASKISLIHPQTEKPMTFEAPLPDGFS